MITEEYDLVGNAGCNARVKGHVGKVADDEETHEVDEAKYHKLEKSVITAKIKLSPTAFAN